VLLPWLDLFKEIFKVISITRVQGDCISLIISLTESSGRVVSRKIGIMITCHFATVVSFPEYQKTYFPFLKKAAEDSNWEVRQVVAQAIPSLCASFGSSSTDPLFAILLGLLNDPQPEVFAYSAESLGLILSEFRNSPLFDQAIERLKVVLSIPNTEVLKATINNIGRILVGIGKEKLEKNKELATLFQSIIKTTMDKEEFGVFLAKNLPGIIFVYGTKTFLLELPKLIEKLMSTKGAYVTLVRATVAGCFHEVVKLFGFDLAIEKLKDHFFNLLADPNIPVINSILTHIEVTLEVFFSQQKQESCMNFINDYFSKLPHIHQKIKSKSWRTEANFLMKLDCILLYLTPERFSTVLMPIFKLTLSSSPRECKLKVCNLLSQILSGFCQNPIRSDIHSLVKKLAKSSSYQNRVSYLEFVCSAIQRMSKHYIKDNFLTNALYLGEDKVIGVQWKFCEIAIDMKKCMLLEDFKNNDKLTLTLEKIIKTTKSQTLREKAENTLKRIEVKDISRNGDKEEDLLMRREREIQRRELMQLEDFKKGDTRGKFSTKDFPVKKGNSRARKATHLVSSVTVMGVSPAFVKVRKPSTGAILRKHENDRFNLEWNKSFSRPLQKMNKRSDLAKSIKK